MAAAHRLYAVEQARTVAARMLDRLAPPEPLDVGQRDEVTGERHVNAALSQLPACDGELLEDQLEPLARQ